jgi:hypothetical protein
MSGAQNLGAACPVGTDLLSSMTDVLVNQVHRWSEQCQRFLEWQRRYVLVNEPDDQLRARHESALDRLLATGRILSAATSAPDFLDGRTAGLVKARMAQLHECWQVTHSTMSAEDAERFLMTAFPSKF